MRIFFICFFIASPVFSEIPLKFHLYSDLIFHLKDSITTFDSFHNLFIAELHERGVFKFSAEINPNPRLFELQYRLNEKLTIFGGKFLIPFNHPNPHTRYGGYVISSQNIGTEDKTLLPDIWSDLGIGLKYKFLEFSSWYLKLNFYVCNGFQGGGKDPLNGEYYPDFSNTGKEDNNSDKAVGFGLSAYFNRFMRVGFSFYTNMYELPLRLYIIGLDSKVIVLKNMDLEAGYIFFHVMLPAYSSFDRGGFYLKLNYDFSNNFYSELMTGISQTDSRIQDEGDKTLVGLKFGYRVKIFDFSLIGLYDLEKFSGKTKYSYFGLRASLRI